MTIKELIAKWRERAASHVENEFVQTQITRCADELENADPAELLCPDPALKGKYPLVLYFDNEEQSRELVAAVMEGCPNLISKTL